jgi:hypothetical protein
MIRNFLFAKHLKRVLQMKLKSQSAISGQTPLRLLVAGMLLSVGCAKAGAVGEPVKAGTVLGSPKRLQELVSPTQEELSLRDRLQSLANAAEERGCKFSDRYRNCEMANVEFQPAHAKSESLNQRILVLDEAFITPSLLMRHKSKLLDLFLQNERGEFHRAQPKFETPVVNKEMQLILDSTQTPARNEALGEAAESMAAMNLLASKNVGEIASGASHGEVVFETLAKYNPEAQYVVAPFPVISEEWYCRIGESSVRNQVDEFYTRALSTLLPRIKELQISHANISWAITDEGSFKKFQSVCGSRPNRDQRKGLVELVQAETVFVRNLARLANLVVVQASPNDYPSDSFDPKSPGTAWSCLGDSRIVSVGYFASLGGSIARKGQKIDGRFIPVQQALTATCVDVFVNGGVNEALASAGDTSENFENGYGIWWNENSFMENILSFSSAPARILSNSWLTPVALSMLIHMQKEQERLQRAPVQAVDVAQSLRNKMFDPIANHQFEVFRGMK